MNKVIFPLFVIIILCFFNCARQVVKKPISKDSLLENIIRWQDKATYKRGTGEMTVSEPDKRFSSYFSFEYNVKEKILSGELLGSFGIAIGTFYFTGDSISIKDENNKEVKEEVFSLLEENPNASLHQYLMWDIPISTGAEKTISGNGWVLSDELSEIFIPQDFRPNKVVLKNNNKIIIKYSNFRSQEGIYSPFKIEAKTEKKSLEIEFRKINLE
jgi:hypothetical protein